MTLIIFLAILAVLILVHESGHFIAAKKSGLTVEEFGFGFPPRLFGIKIGETIYSLNLIPLGGFVKILGEDGNQSDNQKSFASKSIATRSMITAAGVAMNFLLAVLILIIGFGIGLPQVVDKGNETLAKNAQIQIVGIAPNSPAELAGIHLGDAVKAVKYNSNVISIGEIPELQNTIGERKGGEIILEIQRGNEILELKITPRVNPPEGEGALGVALAKTGIVSYPWYQSIWLGVKSSFTLTWAIILGFAGIIKNAIFTGKLAQDISGPVGIAVLTGQAAELGYIYLLQLLALLSLNLTVLNLLPIPALDGGRLLFLGIEKIKGSKVNPKIENIVHTVGLALLMLLALLITWRDILKLK